eukprot:TRINITY_DN1686_c0_g1_i1.p1 TRINITY_DN1686_c0_g1~~TRINITY_DN1686_c0_g1_i1.p1  ORF type:complete len:142 (+),score=13.33 TRINITY_DN1686_c0_g1_i1:758-1183(+)
MEEQHLRSDGPNERQKLVPPLQATHAADVQAPLQKYLTKIVRVPREPAMNMTSIKQRKLTPRRVGISDQALQMRIKPRNTASLPQFTYYNAKQEGRLQAVRSSGWKTMTGGRNEAFMVGIASPEADVDPTALVHSVALESV